MVSGVGLGLWVDVAVGLGWDDDIFYENNEWEGMQLGL